MVSARLILPALCVIGTLLSGFSPQANAQATRTWISGVGDDANPVSRTAPGKTFAGAISKTAAGGTINVLDSGGFGGVTITKSITLDGTGAMAGILVSGTNGVVINAPGATVVLRELVIEGLGLTSGGSGIHGVRIMAAAKVQIERCTISAFQSGITIEGGTQVLIKDCMIRNCTIAGVNSAASVPSLLELQDTRIEGCQDGIVADGSVRVTGTRVSVVGSAGTGVVLGEGGTVTLIGSTIAQNGAGLHSEGSMFVGNSFITGNTGAGLSAVKPGFIRSLKGNQLIDNTPDGKFSKSIPQR